MTEGRESRSRLQFAFLSPRPSSHKFSSNIGLGKFLSIKWVRNLEQIVSKTIYAKASPAPPHFRKALLPDKTNYNFLLASPALLTI